MAKSSIFGDAGLGGVLIGGLGIFNSYDERRAQNKFDLRQLEANTAAGIAQQKTTIAIAQAVVVGAVALALVLLLGKKKRGK